MMFEISGYQPGARLAGKRSVLIFQIPHADLCVHLPTNTESAPTLAIKRMKRRRRFFANKKGH